ncbi:MAG: squalene/phytoene synthase family protein [Bdellovibrionota bacterium]
METTSQIILKKSRSNFRIGFLGLTEDQKRALTAVYAFCRMIDDIVDEIHDPLEAQSQLDQWKQFVENILSAETEQNTVQQELAWACKHFPIQVKDMLWLIGGCESDLYRATYESLDDLLVYCDAVASSVGFMLVAILGVPADIAESYVYSTGRALQLTNILRDVAEDFERGRIYIPRQMLRQYNIELRSLLDMTHENFSQCMFQFSKVIEGYYEKSSRSIPKPFVHRLLPAQAMKKVYQKIFVNIKRKKFQVWKEKIGIHPMQKGWILLDTVLRAYF